MRIIALSDTHFGFEYGRTALAKKQSTERMFDIFKEVVTKAIRLNVDLILLGGDVFNRSQPKKKIISKAYSFIDEFAESGISFVVIPGNHDKSALPEYLLQHFNNNLHFLNRFTEVKFDQLSIIGFPFVSRDPRAALEKASKIAKNNTKQNYLILCHQLFDGACFGPHNHIFTNRFDTLETQNLPANIKLVISGHIHRAQTIQNGIVHYTGSLERTSFMEIIEPKGYLMIDFTADYQEVNFHEIQSSPMHVHEIAPNGEMLLSEVINDINIDSNVRTMIRFTGRVFSPNEIKFLWACFPAKEYPLLSFSPRREKSFLRPLYGNKTWKFHY